MHLHGAGRQLQRRGDVLIVVALQDEVQHLPLALGQLMLLAVPHERVVQHRLAALAARRRRMLEAQRERAERVAARHEHADEHQRVLGVVALGRERPRPDAKRRRIHHEEEEHVLGHHQHAEHPQRHVQAQVAAQSPALHAVVRRAVAIRGESQHPEQQQRAQGVEREALHVPLGKHDEHHRACHHEHHAGHRHERAALLAEHRAYHQPERHEEPSARQDGRVRAHHQVRAGHLRIEPRIHELVLQHPGHVEEVEQKREEREQQHALARHEVRRQARSRGEDGSQQHDQGEMEEHEPHQQTLLRPTMQEINRFPSYTKRYAPAVHASDHLRFN